MSDKDITWVTINGQHIPIGAGESKDEAVKKFLAKKRDSNADNKDRQIENSKKVADELNKEKQVESPKEGLNKTTSDKFVKDLDKARDTRPVQDKWRVDNTHTSKELDERGCKCYTSKGGSTVAVDKNGDIISVCKAKGDRTTTGADLLSYAVRMGGRKLDSFYGNDRFYVNNGFQAVSYTPFNKAYAPAGWKESGCKGESVVFYKYVGKGNAKHIPLTKLPKFTGEDGYDNAMKYRDSH